MKAINMTVFYLRVKVLFVAFPVQNRHGSVLLGTAANSLIN
jgi:hypothetical protein